MMATKLLRRELLKGLAASALLPPALVYTATSAPCFYSAASDQQGQHFLCAWDRQGLRFSKPSPGRAHDVLLNPKRNTALYFARRPGRWFIALDATSGDQLVRINSPDNRHFYGHGVLSADGRYLFTSENQIDQGGRGLIGIYDCSDGYRHLGEFYSHGIGPHQLGLLPDGKTLVVANGGILTLPEKPREKLNISSMQPNLSYIDLDSQQLIGQWQPPHHQLSLRHLDIADTGEVTVGAQFEGDNSLTLPLLFRHKGEQSLQAFAADDSIWQTHQHYIASVKCARDITLVTSPRGGCISLWQGGTLLQLESLRDVAGAAFDPQSGQFVTSNGLGQFVSVQQPGLQLLARSTQLHWDNHMSIAG